MKKPAKKVPKKSVRERVIFQMKQRVKRLLYPKNQKKNLERLKRARYMREEYSKRKKRLNLTFEFSDFKRIKKEAENVGLTPTAFSRDSVLAYLDDRQIPSKETKKQFSELVYLLRNMANNLNQIAHHANTIQRLSLLRFVQTKALLGQLEDIAETFMRRFKR